ncbi:quinol monooxygenase YgiN [Wenyingzhuangia heitensis]|uniref:Quinol monooxygenase YgiN n=1 Tax=Wenyingzhuangia heitensis TaxID=1487859 RepID=A0ABX0UC49_9FLAO|nr:putative quinol monooxygenase [Wenyingzhuangia heitensis]NIJ46393.1 quinol monooxygenase YgiN [Wenyingzhuangia heitensis]
MKKSYLTIVAKIEVAEKDREFMLSELMELVSISKTEKGNIDYILHSDNENPNQFFMLEKWSTIESLESHTQTKHFIHFKKVTEGKLKEFVVHKMTEIIN